MIVVESKVATVNEWNALRQSVGWRPITPLRAAERAITNSSFFVRARENERVVGVARVIGDGGNAFYIQDVIVHPEYQGQGIGAKMMDLVMAYFDAIDSNEVMICLMSAKGKEAFYQKYGFVERPTEHFGAGMTRFITSKEAANKAGPANNR